MRYLLYIKSSIGVDGGIKKNVSGMQAMIYVKNHWSYHSKLHLHVRPPPDDHENRTIYSKRHAARFGRTLGPPTLRIKYRVLGVIYPCVCHQGAPLRLSPIEDELRTRPSLR